MRLPALLSNLRDMKETEDRARPSPHFHHSEKVEGTSVLVNVWSVESPCREDMEALPLP